MKKITFVLPLLLLFSDAVIAQYSTTPIMLSMPMDADTIEEDEPLLVWQSTLSNVENDPRLNVRLSVVQVGEGQTPTEAILENAPVFQRMNLVSNSINYSEIDHELVENTWYAWQVVLLYNGVQVQQSEVFKFIKAEPAVEKISYIALRTKEDNSRYQLVDDILYVTTNEPGDFQFNATISGKNIGTKTIQFTELNADEASDAGKQQFEWRYFKCDTKELDLKKGDYKIVWQANSARRFVLSIRKI